MADWYFGSYNRYLSAPYTPDGTTPETAWYRGTNHAGASAVNLASLSPGDTLWILDNHDSGIIDGNVQGSPPTGITVRGDYPRRPGTLNVLGFNTSSEITVTGLALTGGSLGFTGVDGLLVTNLTVAYQEKGFFVGQESSVDNVVIRNCYFHHLTYEGIECFVRTGYTRDNWLIEDNIISHVGYDPAYTAQDFEGIGLQRLTNSTVRRNHISHCRYGINIWESGSGVAHDIVISDNVIHDITGGVQGWPSRGIMTSGGATDPASFYNLTVTRNRVYNIGREGLRIPMPTGSTGNVCADNIVANVNTEWGTPNTQYMTGTTGWTLSNNRTYTKWPRPAIAARRRRR